MARQAQGGSHHGLAAASDRLLEAGVGFADHQLHARESALAASAAGWRSSRPRPLCRIEVDVRVTTELQRPVQEGLHWVSRTWQMRLTSDLEMPLSQPRAATTSSTLRVETPET